MKIAFLLPQPFRGGTLKGFIMSALDFKHSYSKSNQYLELDCWIEEKANYEFDEIKILLQKKIGVQYYRKDISARIQNRPGCHCSEPREISFISREKTLENYDFVLVFSATLSYHLQMNIKYFVKAYDFLYCRVPEAYPDSKLAWSQIGNAACVSSLALKVFTTTPQTRLDGINYAGIAPENIVSTKEIATYEKIPIETRKKNAQIIHWATNSTPYKNHFRVIEALEVFLGVHSEYKILITGVETNLFDKSEKSGGSYIQNIRNRFLLSRYRKHFIIMGNISRLDYWYLLATSKIHLQSSLYDNGSYSPIEATLLEIPSVFSNYPQMMQLSREYGVIGIHHNPYDVQSIISALERVHVGDFVNYFDPLNRNNDKTLFEEFQNSISKT